MALSSLLSDSRRSPMDPRRACTVATSPSPRRFPLHRSRLLTSSCALRRYNHCTSPRFPPETEAGFPRPNEMQISCKRPEKTYVPYRLTEPRPSSEFRPARVCRLHLRVRPLLSDETILSKPRMASQAMQWACSATELTKTRDVQSWESPPTGSIVWLRTYGCRVEGHDPVGRCSG